MTATNMFSNCGGSGRVPSACISVLSGLKVAHRSVWFKKNNINSNAFFIQFGSQKVAPFYFPMILLQSTMA